MSFRKANALWFHSRNITKWAMKSFCKFQYSLNLLYSYSICCLDLIEYWPHRHLNSLFGKNLSLYLPISTWLVIALVALAQRELEWPKFWSHGLLLIYNGPSKLLSPSIRLRNWLLFKSDAWNVIFHLLARLLYLSFLLKSQESLLGYKEVSLMDLVQSRQLCEDAN